MPQTIIRLARTAQRRVERREQQLAEAIAARNELLVKLHKAGWGYGRIAEGLGGSLGTSGVRQAIGKSNGDTAA